MGKKIRGKEMKNVYIKLNIFNKRVKFMKL